MYEVVRCWLLVVICWVLFVVGCGLLGRVVVCCLLFSDVWCMLRVFFHVCLGVVCSLGIVVCCLLCVVVGCLVSLLCVLFIIATVSE